MANSIAQLCRVSLLALLCATSVFSVSLWLFVSNILNHRRHREHRDCTEKKSENDFSGKA